MTGLLGNSSGWLLASVHVAEGKVNKKWDQGTKNRTCRHGLVLLPSTGLVAGAVLIPVAGRMQAHSFPRHIPFVSQ